MVLAAQEEEEEKEEEIRSWIVRAVSCQVQQQWFNYTEKVDHMVEEAFRLNVKWSLQELVRAINGDGKSGPSPLFKVQVVLQNDKVNLLCYMYVWLLLTLSFISGIVFYSVRFCFVLCDTVVWCVKAVLRVSVVWMWYSVCNIHNTALLSILAQIIICCYLLLSILLIGGRITE